MKIRFLSIQILCLLGICIFSSSVAFGSFNDDCVLKNIETCQSNLSLGDEPPSSNSTIMITGDTADLEQSNIACDSNDNIYVTWEKNAREDNYGSSDEIYLQKYYANGSACDSKILLVNRSDITTDQIALGCSTLQIDSQNNLHLFWYVMDYGSPQRGYVYYQKLDADLQVIIDPKPLLSYQEGGWGTSIFGDMISEVIIDDFDYIHVLCCEEFYMYLDNNGILLDSINLKDEINLGYLDMTIDNTGNVFIVWVENDREIHFQRLLSSDSTITALERTILATGEIVLAPKIVLKDDNLFVAWSYIPNWDYKNTTYVYKQLAYSGEVLSDAKLGFYPGNTCFSKDQSLVYIISVEGLHYMYHHINFSYHLRTFEGDILLNQRRILTITNNPEYFYGPSAFNIQILEDSQAALWLVWFVNDGMNGFQVYLWKTDRNGNALLPVMIVAPTKYIYNETTYNSYPSINWSISNPVSIPYTINIYFTLLFPLVLATIYNFQRRKSKKRH
ncbi:MAG: hypothetical protein ACFFC7_19550 [Candidatus Hermodarchaeota archaeon]